MDPNLSAEITALESQLAILTAKVRANEPARKALYTTLQSATRAAQAPIEGLWSLILAPHTPAALMTLLEMGAIDAIAAAPPSGITASAIATACAADETLVARLLRPLSAAGVVAEAGARTYTPTPLTKLLTARPMRGGVTYMYATATQALAGLPAHLRATHYANPTAAPAAAPTPLMSALRTPAPHFTWLAAQPALHAHFNAFMAAKQAKRSTWLADLPVDTLVHAGFEPAADAVLMVDLGGGAGHDVAAFARAFPGPGRLVLQDLPEVIDAIPADALPARVERVGADLFAALPVRGARAYYMRSVLHNHADEGARAMLRRVADAMRPGYSRLLLAELVLPAVGAGAWGAAHDVNMLALLGGAERSEDEFRVLLASAGLRLVRVHWDPIGDSEAVLEAVLEGDVEAVNGHAL